MLNAGSANNKTRVHHGGMARLLAVTNIMARSVTVYVAFCLLYYCQKVNQRRVPASSETERRKDGGGAVVLTACCSRSILPGEPHDLSGDRKGKTPRKRSVLEEERTDRWSIFFTSKESYTDHTLLSRYPLSTESRVAKRALTLDVLGETHFHHV